MALARERPELELVRATSLEALPRIPLPDAVIIDGDHNYYTVSEELRLIGERAPGAELPLLLFHDVCWPHGRRDDYFAPELIPAEHRQPLAGAARRDRARRARPARRRAALRALGGARGRRRATACSRRSRTSSPARERPPARRRAGLLRLRRGVAPRRAVVGRPRADPRPARPQPGARAAGGQPRPPPRARRTRGASSCGRRGERQARQEALLRRLLESSAFAVAERLSRLRVRAGIATAQSGRLQGRDPPGAAATRRARRAAAG